MCAIGGFSTLVLAIAYFGGALTLPALKAAYAKVKAWLQAHKP